MWPRRKIQLVASSAAPGIEGVRAMLKGVGLEFIESNRSAEGLSEEFTDSWWEKPLECNSASTSVLEESGPVTEWVFWPEATQHNFCLEKALPQRPTRSIQSLIHNILEDEVILRISEHTVVIEGRPLLGHVLNEAGFEPSLLWPTADGWLCQRKQGLHWLLPEEWLRGLMGEDSSLGRHTERTWERATWVVRDTRVDFYGAQESKFIAQMPRWLEPLEEQEVYRNIAMCLELGVSWLDIRLALSSVWHGTTMMTDNLRWNSDDFGWNTGTCGEKLSATPLEHMEDWWGRGDCVLAPNHRRHGDRMAACGESRNPGLADWAGF